MDLLCEEMLPRVADEGLARAADIFIEEGAFNLQQARRYLERAKELGFALRVHADQFNELGGVQLAVELGAECVDHLEALTDAGLEALALGEKKTFAGLLPAVPHFLRQSIDAPARKLLDAGVPYFVATDFNPGSCYTPSLAEAAHFARVRLCLTASEALYGVTAGAADSLGIGDRRGRIAPGYEGDFLMLDLPDIHHFGYAFGECPVM
jgi:imidazolonepropionase